MPAQSYMGVSRVVVPQGSLSVGSPASPHEAVARILLTGDRNGPTWQLGAAAEGTDLSPDLDLGNKVSDRGPPSAKQFRQLPAYACVPSPTHDLFPTITIPRSLPVFPFCVQPCRRWWCWGAAPGGPRPCDPASPVWGNRAEWAASVYAASSFVAARSSYPQPAERKLLSYWLRIQCIDQ